MLISLSFQFIGFLLTYLLHTQVFRFVVIIDTYVLDLCFGRTHAARFGSRAGLGVTIIQYAFYLRRRALLSAASQYDDAKDAQLWWDAHTSGGGDDDFDFSRPGMNGTMSSTPDTYHGHISPTTTEWVSFFLMSLGWFVLLTSVLGFWRVKRWERGIRQANVPPPVPTTENPHRGTFALRVLGMFGVPVDFENEVPGGQTEEPTSEEEARLTRDLRASGLL